MNAPTELPKKYWFKAKTYGYGWGLPLCWQGWVVLLGYIAGIIAVAIVFPPDRAIVPHAFLVAGLTAILVAICMRTGEPPRWRWGQK